MKVLFVASGNKAVGTVSAFVRAQFESLREQGLDMVMCPVTGKGWKGYAKHIFALRKLIKQEKPDIIHAHYSTCGHLAKLASLGLKPKIVVSILGSFPHGGTKLHLVRFCVDHLWDATIVKSERTRKQLDRSVPVIGNGVNLSQFLLIDKEDARNLVGFQKEKKYVIFVSNPARTEKNYSLAASAVEAMHEEVELVPVFNKSHDEVVKYMCAADALILTSVSEGSPNVIKEAMACNCPIVSTDVGDVRWVTEGVEGTYVADAPRAMELTGLLKNAISFERRTAGREKIIGLGLTAEAVADKIIGVYNSVLTYDE